MTPALSVKNRGAITFNTSARELLGIDSDKGGRVGFAQDTDTREFYIITHDKASGHATGYFVQKNGRLADVVLPVKLGVHFKLPDTGLGRIRIMPNAVTHNGLKAYKLAEY